MIKQTNNNPNPACQIYDGGQTRSYAGISGTEKTLNSFGAAQGQQIISSAQSDLFPSKIKLAPEEKEALLEFPPKEILFILTWPDNDNNQNVFDDIFANNVLPFKKDDLKDKSGGEIIQIIESYVPASGSHADDIRKKLQIIISDEFKNELIQITKNLQEDNRALFARELLKIFLEFPNKFDRNNYLSVLKTNEFKNFYQKIKTVCGANRFDDIRIITHVYKYPRLLKNFRSDSTRQKIKFLKENLPSVNPSLLAAYISNLEYLSFKQIQERILLYNKIKTLYPRVINEDSELDGLLCVEIGALRALAGPGAKQNVYDYINAYYPHLLLYDMPDHNHSALYNFLSDLGGFAVCLKNLKITAKEFDELLQLFSIKFGETQNLSGFTKIAFSFDTKKLLAEKQDVKKYLDELRLSYPGLDCGLENIEEIVFSYYNKEKFSELNRLYEQLNSGKKPGCPVAAAKDYDIKIKVFNALIKKNFEKIIIGDSRSAFNPDEAGNMGAVLEKINDGTAEKLYTALSETWHLRHIELDLFLEVLTKNNLTQLYLNKKNAAVFYELKDKYNILFKKENNNSVVESLDNLSPNYMFKLLDMSRQLTRDPVKDYILKTFDGDFKNYNGRRGIYIKNLMYILSLPLPTIAEEQQTAKIEETIRALYLFNDKDASRLFRSLSAKYNHPAFLETIKKPETLQIFNTLIENYRFPKTVALLYAAKLALAPGGLKILTTLSNDLQIDLINKPGESARHKLGDTEQKINQDIAYVLNFILPDKSILNNISDPNFIVFYKKVINHFYGNTHKKEIILHLSRLYDEVKDKPGMEKLLFSEDYRNTVSWIADEFHVTSILPSLLPPILKIAKNISGIKLIIKKLNEPVCANDLFLLSCAAEYPQYEELLFNRDKMLKELKDCVKIVTSESKERMTLEQCSNLQLLRLVLFKRALRDKDFLKTMAETAIADTKDAGTEYGGNLTIGDGGKVMMDVRPSSIILNNSAYQSVDSLDLINGFSWFHYHPFKSKRETPVATPSGDEGDLGVSRSNDLSGAVFVIISDPNENSGKVSINTSFYFTDKRDPEKTREAVFNFGAFSPDVPVN